MFKNKKILAGGAVFFVAAFWFYIKPHYMDAKPPVVFTEQQIAEAARPTVTLPEKVFNLKAPASAPNYVKAVIALEFADPEHKFIKLKGEPLALANEAFTKEHEPEMHRISDVITALMASHTLEELVTTEGREKLKDEIVIALNHELAHEKVENVYFATFITQ